MPVEQRHLELQAGRARVACLRGRDVDHAAVGLGHDPIASDEGAGSCPGRIDPEVHRRAAGQEIQDQVAAAGCTDLEPRFRNHAEAGDVVANLHAVVLDDGRQVEEPQGGLGWCQALDGMELQVQCVADPVDVKARSLDSGRAFRLLDAWQRSALVEFPFAQHVLVSTCAGVEKQELPWKLWLAV